MNHPHEQQAAAMARAGELPDGEQLRECINSGQVSSAQVVAHAESGEVTGWPAGMLQDDSRQLSKALSRDPNARALVREAVFQDIDWKLAGLLIEAHELARSQGNSTGTSNWAATLALAVQAALAAERAEVARLREALTLAVRQNEHDMVMTGDELRFCCAALNNPNQGATNHD